MSFKKNEVKEEEEESPEKNVVFSLNLSLITL